ncbi:tyrosinase family protein [Erythrobacter sp.]|uniref:tyrosinase family protein n=1 Tax=Erythrobacter sp. TaxID=1042 RepID=UPI00311F282B
MFKSDRRSVLAGGTSLIFLASLGGCEELKKKIANRPVRKDIANLAINDPILDTYRDAIAQMQALPQSDPRNWTRQAQIHLNTCPHGNWFFLPWHRAYLVALDDIVRKLTGNKDFSMPYWNWTCQRAVPTPFWQAGSVLNYSPRSANSSSMANESIVGVSAMNTILAQTDFQLFGSGKATALRGAGGFQGQLEQGPHNYIHGFVGGTMGTYMSPLDPIFWLHHCNIDRVWFDWNSSGKANTNDPVYTNFRLDMFVDGNQQPMDFLVGAMGLAPLLTYRYEPPKGCGINIRRLDEASLKAVLERGSTQQLKVSEQFQPLGRNVTISGRAPERARLTLPLETLAPAMERSTENDRLVLRLDDVRLDTDQENFFVRVYVNKPENEAPSPDSPSYAGAFAFFVDNEHNHGPLNYVVDLSGAVNRMRNERQSDMANGAQVSFELVPIRDDEQALAAAQRSALNIGAVVPQLVSTIEAGGAKPTESER